MPDYAYASIAAAYHLFGELARQGPPKKLKHDGAVTLGKLAKEYEPLERFTMP